MTIDWETVTPRKTAGNDGLRDLRYAVTRSRELAHWLATSTTPLLVVINDPHRATRSRAALECVADVARQQGHELRFRVLIATGTHRFSDAERRAFEVDVLDGLPRAPEAVAWHDATAPNLVALGGVGSFHPWLAAAPRVLALGSVEPHYFAGLTGAHKTVTIGCLSRHDIERNHAGALAEASQPFALAGNPVFDGIVAFLDGLRAGERRILAINEIIVGGELITAAVGDPLDTLHELAPRVREIFAYVCKAPVDLLHLRVPLPLGRNVYQADKALKNSSAAVRDNGGILLEAPCAEGVGPDAFMNLLRRAPTYAAARDSVRRNGYAFGDHKAVKLRHLTDPAARNVRVALVSPHVPREAARTAGLQAFDATEPALRWLAKAVQPSPRRGLLVEDAGHVCVLPA